MLPVRPAGYPAFLAGIRSLVEHARRQTAWTVNSILTATYWEVGRRIVEREQGGRARAAYGEALLKRLSADLSGKFGQGFSLRNLRLMRQLYLAWPPARIRQTLSAESAVIPRPGQESPLPALVEVMKALPLSWSHYVRLLQVDDRAAWEFYAVEALRGAGRCGNWTGRSSPGSSRGRPCPDARPRCSGGAPSGIPGMT